MIITMRDEKMYIIAVCEYIIIDDECNQRADGDRIFIKYLAIHPPYRKDKKMIQKLVKKLMVKHPMVVRYDWFRKEKYPDRRMSLVTRAQGEKLTREV